MSSLPFNSRQPYLDKVNLIESIMMTPPPRVFRSLHQTILKTITSSSFEARIDTMFEDVYKEKNCYKNWHSVFRSKTIEDDM